MAATDVPVLQAVRNGTGTLRTAAIAGDSVNGHTATNSGLMMLEVTNGDATSKTITVSFAAQTNLDGQVVTAETFTIVNATTRLIGPWPQAMFGTQLAWTTNGTSLTTFRAYSIG